MIFTVISPIIYIILKLSKYTVFLIPSMIIVVLFMAPGYATSLFWIPVYLIGAYFGIYKKRFIEEKGFISSNRKVRLLFLILNVVLLIGIFSYGVAFRNNWRLYYIYRMLSGLCIVFLFLQIKWKTVAPKYMQNTFFTYCTHACIVGISTKVCALIFDANVISMIFGYFVSVVVTVGISIVIAETMKRCCPRLLSVLTGNRKERN